jgi:hypothetical protein
MDWKLFLETDSKRRIRVEGGREFLGRKSLWSVASDSTRPLCGSWPDRFETGHRRNASRRMKHSGPCPSMAGGFLSGHEQPDLAAGNRAGMASGRRDREPPWCAP